MTYLLLNSALLLLALGSHSARHHAYLNGHARLRFLARLGSCALLLIWWLGWGQLADAQAWLLALACLGISQVLIAICLSQPSWLLGQWLLAFLSLGWP